MDDRHLNRLFGLHDPFTTVIRNVDVISDLLTIIDPPHRQPIRLGNWRKKKRVADPAKKAARKRQGKARAKNRKR